MPRFNASLNPEVNALILKHYMHIGFAVDTEAGLAVPVIRDAAPRASGNSRKKSNASRMQQEQAASSPTKSKGGCFTISSLGAIGGTGFTPIVNAPEVAILGVARLATKPSGTAKPSPPRKLLSLSLSYDHRAINGAEAGRFMAALTTLLTDFRRLAL